MLGVDGTRTRSRTQAVQALLDGATTIRVQPLGVNIVLVGGVVFPVDVLVWRGGRGCGRW